MQAGLFYLVAVLSIREYLHLPYKRTHTTSLVAKMDQCKCLLLLLLVVVMNVAITYAEGVSEYYRTEEDCIDDIPNKLDRTSSSSSMLIRNAVTHSYWTCAKDVIRQSPVEYISELKNIFEIEQRKITKELTSLKTFIESTLPMNTVLPAFQWAQSLTEILLNVKFSHKIDAPATLNVEPLNVTITSNSLYLLASDSRKNFKLEFDLFSEIVPEECHYQLASVGRMTFNLKKAKAPIVWSKLSNNTAVKSSQRWWAMVEKYASEIEAFEKVPVGATANATTTATTDDVDGKSDAAATTAIAAVNSGANADTTTTALLKTANAATSTTGTDPVSAPVPPAKKASNTVPKIPKSKPKHDDDEDEEEDEVTKSLQHKVRQNRKKKVNDDYYQSIAALDEEIVKKRRQLEAKYKEDKKVIDLESQTRKAELEKQKKVDLAAIDNPVSAGGSIEAEL